MCVCCVVCVCVRLCVRVCDCILENRLCGHKYWNPFLAVDKCYSHALSRDTMHLRLDGQVCFYRRLFCDAVKPRGYISWPVWPLRGIKKTAWGAKLILTADLIHHSSCASLGLLLMARHCHLYLNVYFSPPMAPHLPPPPTPYRLNPCYCRC